MATIVHSGGFGKGMSAAGSRLACLVAVARSHGLGLTVPQLIRDNLLVGTELEPDRMLACARRAGFRCTLLGLGWGDLLSLGAALPAIALRRDGGAVVIVALEADGGAPVLVLHDPGQGGDTLRVGEAEFAALATGDVMLLRPDQSERADARPFGFRLIAMLMLADRRTVADMAISSVMLSVLALTPIVFWSLLGSDVLANHAETTFRLLCLGAVALILFEGAFTALRRHVLVRLTMLVDRRLSVFMFDRLLALPIEVYETTPVGAITHKISQIAKVRSFLTGQLFGSLLDAGVLIVFLPVMAFVNPLLTLVVVGFCVAIATCLMAMLPVYRRRMDAVQEAETARGAFLSETVSGIRTVKTLALDRARLQRWDMLTAEATRLRLRESDFRNLIQSLVAPLERLTLSGTIAIGVYVALTTKDAVGIGTLLTFIMLTQRVAAPMLQLSQLVQQFDEARTAVSLAASLFNQPLEEGRSGYGIRSPLRGQVVFSNLRFTYRGAAAPALRDVNFEIPAGAVFGIMGRSGSGKTTVTRLLQRLHADYAGSIRIDGVDVREYDVDHLRASLGVVLQDNFLFAGTIAQNIAVAKSDAGPDEIVRAARLAGAEEFIDKLPGGYETAIYEGSPNLSGGQRQRIAIARALITDPRILILDEATSALDADSEAIVNANLRRIAVGRTTIVISHRLSSLVLCDAILVLDGGEVRDIGRHADLLQRSDIYSGLWARQTAHVADEETPVRRLTGGARV